jgi:hypothetical protein
VEVEDVPWVVTRVGRQGEALRIVLNDGSEQDLDLATLRIGTADIPYCAVKRGAFQARFNRAAAFQLLALADYDERSGRGTLHVGGREIALVRRG